MKKLRIVILSLMTFSLFCSLFFSYFNLYYDIVNNYNGEFLKKLDITIAANPIVYVVMFVVVLLWYVYHREDRNESITNGLILLMYLVYLALFIFSYITVEGPSHNHEKYIVSSYIVFMVPGFWLIISIIPVTLHFIASVKTGGYDNVGEPDNMFAFMATLIGLTYIITLILTVFITYFYDSDSVILQVYSLDENGLVYTLIIVSFILCAGFRYNYNWVNLLNISMNFTFTIWWIVLVAKYNGVQRLLATYNLIFIIPLFVLSIFIFIHYLNYDRFYKSRTKLYLDKD